MTAIKINTPRIGNVWYNEPFFGNLFNVETTLVESIDDLNKVDVLVFWGGEDITPTLYNERNVYSHSNPSSLHRDKFETLLYETALGSIPMIGICRGAQLLCALTGGKLWQHVDGHGHDHLVSTKNGEMIKVTSTHHQMMRPGYGTDMLGWSTTNLSATKKNAGGEYRDNNFEAEICFNNDATALMIQGHPEYSNATPDFISLTKALTKKYIGVL